MAAKATKTAKSKASKPAVKRQGGISRYKPAYAALLIDHLAEGLSLAAFGGVVGVSTMTVQNWADKYPDFAEAKELGLAKALLFWEKIGLRGIQGDIPYFNPTAYIFTMANRFNYSRTDQGAALLAERTAAKDEKPKRLIIEGLASGTLSL